MAQLTKRESQILAYMSKQITEKGYPPTVREICTALGIKSTSTVHKDINNLVEAGFLRKDPSKPRALVLIEDPTENTSAATKKSTTATVSAPSEKKEQRGDIVDIPLVGQVAAGTPILAEENVTDTISVPQRFLGSGTNYMLTVRGESMIEAGIMDGDYILVEQQTSIRNGDIVVAMVDGFESEATVKTFYKEKDHIRLQPENSTMSPIIVNDVKILGKVKGVFRYF